MDEQIRVTDEIDIYISMFDIRSRRVCIVLAQDTSHKLLSTGEPILSALPAQESKDNIHCWSLVLQRRRKKSTLNQGSHLVPPELTVVPVEIRKLIILYND